MNARLVIVVLLAAACGHDRTASVDAGIPYDFRADIVPSTGYAVVLGGDSSRTSVVGFFDSYQAAVAAVQVPVTVTGPTGSRTSVLAPGYCAQIGAQLGTPTMEHVQLEAARDLSLIVYSAECCGTGGCMIRSP